MSIKDSLIGLLIIAIWGFNFVVISWGVEHMPPLLMGVGRFMLVAIIGSLFVKKPNIPWQWLALYALLLCFGQFAFLFSAMSVGMPAGIASLVLQSQALFTIVISALLLKEKIKFNQAIALFIAGLGLVQIAVTGLETDMTVLGFALTIIAAIAWGSGNVINRFINQKGYRADLGLVVWSAWFAIIPFALSSYFIEGTEVIYQSVVNIRWQSVAVLLYLAFAASILGYSLWSYLLAHYPAGQVAPLTLGVPVVGMVCASWFLNERLSSDQIVGIVLVMLGLVVNAFGGKLSLWVKEQYRGFLVTRKKR